MASVQNIAPFPPGPVSLASTLTIPNINVTGVLPILDQAGDILITATGRLVGAPPNNTAIPQNPTGTSDSKAQDMMGLNVTFTPATTGNYLFRFNYTMSNSASGSASAYMYIGTGAAPANAAAVPVGAIDVAGPQHTILLAAGQAYGFLSGYVSGLTLSTTYWLDMAVTVPSGGGTASPLNVVVQAIEV